MVFTSTYPSGGYTFGPSSLPTILPNFTGFDWVGIAQMPGTGLKVVWDRSGAKIRVYWDNYPIQTESVTITNHAGTLAHYPTSILGVSGTVSASETHFKVIPLYSTGTTPVTPAAGEVSVDLATGNLLFSSSVTNCVVDYITNAELLTTDSVAALTHVRFSVIGT
jgi:hypothetical protein